MYGGISNSFVRIILKDKKNGRERYWELENHKFNREDVVRNIAIRPPKGRALNTLSPTVSIFILV